MRTVGATSPNAKDRKKKCVSEQYVRERKSNATKQFSYNKLKNEKHSSGRHEHQKSGPPQRPPQPKIANNAKEGMLIDLSPPPTLDTESTINGGSVINILDAPIDVPTEGDADTTAEASASDLFGNETSKLEPPPYHSPPTYMNSYGFTQQASANVANYRDFNGIPRARAADPFDTSHIKENPNQIYANHSATIASSNAINASNYGYPPQNNANNKNKLSYPYGLVTDAAKQSLTNSQFDDLVQSSMASMSPKSSYLSLNSVSSNSTKNSNVTQWPSQTQLNSSGSASQNDSLSDHFNTSLDTTHNETAEQLSGINESLSDSLKVNLSSMTLHDADEDSCAANTNYNPSIRKFDKTFLAELEKEIYKNDVSASSLIANTSQTYASQCSGKEVSVSSIPNDIYVRTGNSLVRLHNDTFSSVTNATTPTKSNNTAKSTNQEVASIKLNYISSSPTSARSNSSNASNTSNAPNASLYANKKLNFDGQSTAEPDSTAVLSQIWMERQAQKNPTTNDGTAANPIYNNNLVSSGQSISTEKTHNFIALSNRPVSSIQPTQPMPSNAHRSKISNYNTVPANIYGSIASGNVYDVVTNSAAGSIYYGAIPASNGADYYEAVIPNESVIYDEVAADELLRPHRPAPLAPPVLSAQQIQRRLERAQKQIYGNVGTQNIYGNTGTGAESTQIKVQALLQEIGGEDEGTEHEAVQALQAANWDHSLAVRHFKVERLLK